MLVKKRNDEGWFKKPNNENPIRLLELFLGTKAPNNNNKDYKWYNIGNIPYWLEGSYYNQLIFGIPLLLKDSKPPSKETEYVTIYLEFNNELVMIGTKNKKALWIVSKKKSITNQQYNKLTSIAKKSGFKLIL